jgi:putative spermidine/putrescine transport system permease protein
MSSLDAATPTPHAPRLRVGALLAWPTIALLGFAVIPFALLLRISLAPQDANDLWKTGFSLDAYRALLERSVAATLSYSVGLAVLVAVVSTALAFPLAYLIARMRRTHQVAWLILMLVSLSLSDVLIAFSWQVMLSKRIGLSRVLVLLGLLDRPDSLTPSSGAVLASLIYVAVPFGVLTLYPTLSGLAPELTEAARTMGASPTVAFRTVVIPFARGSLLVSFAVSVVITLGAYVAPLVLGRPQHWTMAVLIGNAAIAGHDLPRAAAMSVGLLACVALLVGVCLRLLQGRAPR